MCGQSLKDDDVAIATFVEHRNFGATAEGAILLIGDDPHISHIAAVANLCVGDVATHILHQAVVANIHVPQCGIAHTATAAEAFFQFD